MKKTLIGLVSALMLCGCSEFYQVMRLQTPKGAVTTVQNVQYVNNECTISYNFWDRNGNGTFSVYNNSDETIHIYLKETFWVKNGLASDLAQMSQTQTSRYSSDIVSIPPKAHRTFACPRLQSQIYEFNDVETCPNGEQLQEKSFNETASPLKLRLCMTYSVGQNADKKLISNDFFVNQLVNYPGKDFYKSHNDTIQIDGVPEIIETQDLRSPDKFFIRY